MSQSVWWSNDTESSVANKDFLSLALGWIWALTQVNLSLGFAKNKSADQPAHPRSLISAFVIRFLESIIP